MQVPEHRGTEVGVICDMSRHRLIDRGFSARRTTFACSGSPMNGSWIDVSMILVLGLDDRLCKWTASRSLDKM